MTAPVQPVPASPRRTQNSSRAARTTVARPFLEHTTTVRIRFQEVDSLHVVWHGHYVTFLEEARRAFGREFGIDYTTFLEHRVGVPLVQIAMDYLAPARLSDVLEITARLLRSESARLDFEYRVCRQSDGALLATGHSVQVFTTPEGGLLLQWPEFMLERLKAWEPLWQTPPDALPQQP
jgi:acyl-CoA thioester hydrolase